MCIENDINYWVKFYIWTTPPKQKIRASAHFHIYAYKNSDYLIGQLLHLLRCVYTGAEKIESVWMGRRFCRQFIASRYLTRTFLVGNLQVLCWRTVPVRNNQIGEVARSSEPFIRQAFVTDAADGVPFDEDDFKRRVFALRKRSTHAIPKPGRRFYVCSLSHTVIVYKGQFTSDQLWAYFDDLQVKSFTCSKHVLLRVLDFWKTMGYAKGKD